MLRRLDCLAPTTALVSCLTLAAPALGVLLDFEDLGANLPIAHPDSGEPELFYNGYSAYAAGLETDFSSQGVLFENDFQDFGGGCCWQGWAYSQTTDTTTPGFDNQHSAFAGGGAAGSATYGVAFTGGVVGAQADVARITLTGERLVDGAWFTNTTYAALAMRDGDAFAKKFGGASGDDPDYFLLTVSGLDASDAVTGSLEIALADFRFADSALDYILDDWAWVDLSPLGAVASLRFELDSSDQAFGFLNTPSYFAMDGLVFVPEPGSAALLALGLLLLARRRS